MAAVPIITVTCQYCSRARHPFEVRRFGDGIIQCWDCWEKDSRQIDCFVPPLNCQGCNTSFADLAAAERTEHVKMFPHMIDAAYTLLCERCDRAHVRLRKDLYRGTRFGWDQKL